MNRLISAFAITAALVLTACVDTTGITADSKSGSHPQTSANAAVTVIEYGDLQCPACRGAETLINEPLIQKYGKQISFEFRHFPLQSIHRYAMDAAQAAECAADQGKFWEYKKLAYEKQEDLSRDALYSWATELQLDEDLFDRCFRSRIKRDAVIADYDEGKALGVNSTPTYVINGKIVTDNNQIMATVEQALAGAATRL